MSIIVLDTSTQCLRNAAPAIVDYPFSVGMWVNQVSTASSRILFTLTDTGSTNHYIRIQLQSARLLQQSAIAGGSASTQTAAASTNLVNGVWAFIVSRMISSTERRTALWNQGASVPFSFMSTSAAMAPTGLDTMVLGAGETSAGLVSPFNGSIAEFWLANDDVGHTGENLTIQEMVQLGLGGPFSMNSVAPKIVDYRSFRSGIPISINEVYRNRIQPWTETNGPIEAAPHPPLPYWFVRPGQNRRLLVI